ncbi:beta/gamma crystallin domain-containing protein 1 isoform X1 [Bufo bufo]|uniref:beta/gamma crystallin domain-containing protein 1 isoform X1 n=2 Tax=Bufo bufo TaxID=8384 RepID=UPI001ABE3368|nr:beta/gamma crystallin domain-containing protein 1 isoform X1 [Bufo bufo]
MEKEKKISSFKRLGKFFKGKSADPEKAADEVHIKEVHLGPGDDACVKEPPASEAHISHVDAYMETKKKPFGSWRHKKKSRNSLTLSPPSSPGHSESSDRSFDATEGDHQLQPYSVTGTSTDDFQILSSNQKEANTNLQENMSRSPSAELPKKDSTKKPVLGKFGNLFNSTKKKQSKGAPESPTSPTNEKTGTYKSLERKRAQVLVASSSNAHNQVPATPSVDCASDQHSQLVSEPTSPVDKSIKVTSNGNVDNDHTSESKDSAVKPEKDSRVVEAESPVLSPEVFSASGQTLTLSPTSNVDRQSNEKIVPQFIRSPVRRSSSDSEGKLGVRKVSQEIHIVKNGSPKVLTRKTAKFSSRASDPKIRISERSVQKLGSPEKFHSAKVSSPVAFSSDNTCPGSTSGNSSLSEPVSIGDSSPARSPSEGEVFIEPLEENASENARVLAFDIYLSKSAGTDSQSSLKTCSNGDTVENSLNMRKINRKRRSLKSQSSHEENKAENTALQDNVFEESTFEGVKEFSKTPDGDLTTLSPESNGPTSPTQELKAGANHKPSPKGESDKDKQQHPASSPVRKKNVYAPSSPTDRRAHGRDPLFRNQTVSAKASEFNQPVPVSTTKDSYVEKVPESLAGCAGETSCNTVGEDSSATAVGGVDRRTKQQSNQGEQKSQSNTNHPSDTNAAKAVSLNDSSKSTVTSKLNIPPKPKNVELPIKPKVVDQVDEDAIAALIPKGSIASKVSLFESKRTSHKQIDFYATKNISQQKKYVERAKLNFGKQVKGAWSKDNSSSSKPASNSSFGKKTENGHYGIKADKKKEEGTVVTPPSQTQMENSRNGFELAESDKLLKESILPSEKNGKHKEPTSEQTGNVNVLSESSSKQTNDLQLDGNTKDTLSQFSENTSDHLVEDSGSSEGGGVSHLDPPDMGNKHSSMKEPTVVAVTRDDTDVAVTKESNTLHSDDVDSSLPSTVPSEKDQSLFNVSKEITEVEREAQKAPSERKDTDNSREARMDSKQMGSKSKDVLNAKEDVQKVNTDSREIHKVNSDLVRKEITNDTSQQLTDTEQMQSSGGEVKEKSSLHENPDVLSSVTHQKKEILPITGSLALDAVIPAGQEQSTSVQTHRPQNPTKDATEKLEGSSYTANTSPESEDSVHEPSPSPQLESGECFVPSSFSPQNKLPEESDKGQPSIIHYENISPKPDSEILLDVTNDTVSCPEPAKVDGSIYETNEQKGDLKRTLNPSDTENVSDLQLVVEAGDEMSEKHKNTEVQQVNVLNGDNMKETTVSFEVNSNDSDIPDPSVLQNGGLFDSRTITYTNRSLQHTSENLTNLQGSLESSFNDSVTNEEYTLDSSSDMEKFAETIRKLESPITLAQKRKTPRAPKSPGPYCGLPPIREDYLEKILDNEAFSFGLGKKDRAKDLAPMALFKMQSKETAEKLRPKRASAEQSLLLKSLRSKREPLLIPQETCDKENADVTDIAVKRSRIESMYSGFKSPFAARSEENVFSPSITTVSTITTSFDTPRKEFSPSSKSCDLTTTDSVQTAHSSVREGKGDSSQPSSEFLHSDSLKQSVPIPVQSMDSNVEGKSHTDGGVSVTLPQSNGHLDLNHSTPEGNRTAPLFDNISALDKPAEIFYFKGQEQNITNIPEGFSLNHSEKINPRPGKVIIFTEPEHGDAMFEIFSDIIDCTSWKLSPTIFIKTIRGCWILYELPNYEGRTIALEEGDIEVTSPWGDESQDENSRSPFVIGSIRQVVKDYSVCRIDLFTDPDGLGAMTSYNDDTEEVQVYGRLQRTCSIKVHHGVWLIYEESGFQGVPFILEPAEYPDLSFLNIQEAYIGSMRPLKMGSRKVEIPYEPKIVIFEKPMCEGRQVELDKEMLTLQNLEILEGTGEEQEMTFDTVGSMRVLSGLWVGYENPSYEGHQYLLEEGDYDDWSQWGGCNGLLQSLRPILSDFSTPHMVMYSEKDFDEKASNINVLGIISNMEETGFGVKIQSINVLSGVWVAYESPDFTGAQYILEKGMYANFSDWGAKNGKISSLQPINMESIENAGHFRVELFSEADFKGQSQLLEEDLSIIEESFKVKSCKVTSGRWTAYDQADFSGNLWVLEEGRYPNLCAMGCPHDTVIRSMKTINYEFSDPSLVLYGKENCRGRRVKLNKETTDLQAMGYSPDLRSLEVLGGIWVFYEYENYRGRQLLISPSKIAQWSQFCGWNKIGSLRPVRQKRLYFKLRNKASGMLMSTNGTLDDIKLLRIQVMEDTGAEDQIWVYHKGVFRCRIAEDCSLAIAGTVITTGSKLGLSLEQSGASMLWNVSPDGRIYSRSKPNFVLDIKGGSQYDQQHIVLNHVTEGKLSQLWEICVL